MSVERIINRSRRAYACDRCHRSIVQGSRYRRVTLFPADVDYLCGDAPAHLAYHLSCPPY